MDFFGKLSSKNSFGGIFGNNKTDIIINIICGVVVIGLIVVLFICIFRKSKFTDKVNNDSNDSNDGNDSNDNELSVYLILRDGCYFATKALKQFKEHGMKIGNYKVQTIDLSKVSSMLGEEVSKKVGGATPALVTSNNKVILGLRSQEDYEKFVNGESDDSEENNENNDNDENDNNDSEKDVLLIGNMECPFCQRAEKLMKDLGIDFTFIESDSPAGKKHMKGFIGVPLIKKPNTNTIIKGFIEPEIRALKN